MSKSIVSALALSAALSSHAPAFAQDAPGDDQKITDTIVVTGTRADGGVSTATFGSSITVLRAEDLRDRQTQQVSDILRDVPGIAVSRTGPVGGLTQVRIRGAEGNHTLVMIDGIEASDATYGEYDFATLFADDGARVEVLRGEQSALYGSDAIGGVINYITASGRDLPGFSARLEGGAFDTVQGGVRGAGIVGDLDYALTGSYSGIGGYVIAPGGSRKIGSKIGTLGGKFGYQIGSVALRAVARYNHTDAELNNQDYFVTGNATDEGGSYKNDAFYGLVGARIGNADDRWVNDFSAQMQDSKRTYFDQDRAVESGSAGQRQKASWVSTLRLGSGPISHSLTGAVDYEREEFHNRGAISAANPKRSTTNWGFVGQYDLKLDDRAGIGLAIRHNENSRFRNDTTWRAQASYRFNFGTRLHAATGTGVKAPTFSELFGYSPTSGFVGNPNLKPEKSTGWEVGVEQSFLDGDARIDATYFEADLKDKIVSTFSPVYTAINAPGKSPHKGVEVSADANLPAGFRFNASYTYLDAENEAGIVLIRRAKHIGSANLAWRSSDDRFGATVTVRHNGKQLDTNFATYVTAPLDAFTLVNLGAAFEVSDGISIYGRVENLFKERYVENVGFLTAGRAAYGGVRIRL
ncbi:TonB-dependent receptor plug domain-containing protein [Sphingobium boeckii]|uniref:Vitamin B12 transporter n=1 Tax=Sphingobium boeckii TaxID=1082345 RepID=A0A7W9AJA8_9SPHN|nr:TonB-dependent receptor [Sphingobium boeckii]MBB5686487.1 vitamin B12 transporter [Sphingobium boeckii]